MSGPEYWGLAASFDLKDCNPDIIRNSLAITKYAKELCHLIDMKPFGECQVVHFGEDERVAGFSMVQLIETSLISGHFANATNSAYIDIFSCKHFDPEIANLYSKKFFQANLSTVKVNYRI